MIENASLMIDKLDVMSETPTLMIEKTRDDRKHFSDDRKTRSDERKFHSDERKPNLMIALTPTNPKSLLIMQLTLYLCSRILINNLFL